MIAPNQHRIVMLPHLPKRKELSSNVKRWCINPNVLKCKKANLPNVLRINPMKKQRIN